MTTLLKAGLLSGVVAAAAFAGPAGASTILVNGGFESGTPGNAPGIVNGANYADMPTLGPATDVFAGLNGWPMKKGAGVEVQTDNSNPNIDAHGGEYYISFDTGTENTAIQQSVSLGIGKFMLSFWYSPESTGDLTNGINYLLTGILSGKVLPSGIGATVGNWTQVSFEFIVTEAKTYTLAFVGTGRADGVGGLLDDIEIASIPVPASGLLLLGGLGGLAFWRRRKPV
jgi:hypothetical protein